MTFETGPDTVDLTLTPAPKRRLSGPPTPESTRSGITESVEGPSIPALNAEPPLKRRQPSSEPEPEPASGPSWAEWQRLRDATGIRSVSKRDDPSAVDIPPQRIVAFPLQFGFATGGPSSTTSTGSANTATQGERNPMDPALSSVRSSADQATTGGSNTESPQLPPELRFSDETLHSATNTDNSAVLEAALQHATAESNQDEDHDMSRLAPPSEDIKKDQPFSRSPELRISHKLAERKRRKEMKDMFDELRELLPADRGSKSSKWEILSKAIDHITYLKNSNQEQQRELERVRRELEVIRGGGAGYPYPGYNPVFTANPPAAYPPAPTQATPAPVATVPANPVAPTAAPATEAEPAKTEGEAAATEPTPAQA